jgi:hypothetical protein
MSYETGYNWSVEGIHVDTVAADAHAIDFRGVTNAVIHIPAASSSVTALAIHVATDHDKGKTYHPLYDSSGAVSLTVAHTRAIRVPDSVYGARSIKLVSNADGAVDMTFMY